MLWQKTQVYDVDQERSFYVSYLSILQPKIQQGVYHATVSREKVGFYDAKEVAIQKIDDVWTIIGEVEGRMCPSDHPFLTKLEKEYIAVARKILAQLDDQFCLDISLDTETDSDHQSSLVAGTLFTMKQGKTPTFYPDESALDHIPGAGIIERYAEIFSGTVGVEFDESGILNGDFEMQIAVDGLSIKHNIDDWILEVTSSFAENEWQHGVSLTVPSDTERNIVDRLKFEGKSPSEKLAFDCSESPFDTEFPKMALGAVSVISVTAGDEGSLVYSLNPAEVR